MDLLPVFGNFDAISHAYKPDPAHSGSLVHRADLSHAYKPNNLGKHRSLCTLSDNTKLYCRLVAHGAPVPEYFHANVKAVKLRMLHKLEVIGG
ncbi:hypothetical protein K7X08_030720 [Anisodus acutangulus]|uniref:Uncharacterized protein n=1 Tax=Anisodus acutangulus TaxID=402998 RepID=A0A9Q1LZY9_9SOLA|nr:hypothetical protein K7X08_030720 [Anisodus acutangulus]